jgi:nitrite reductase/ring-hydroxylating ferredoxin subunit
MQERSLIKPERAPSADQFAQYPASWFLFGSSASVKAAPVSKTMFGRKIVAFRTESGKLVVSQGDCPHMGADLGCGKVVAESIQCPFHGWRYGTDGHCVEIPRAAVLPQCGTGIPPFARLQVYPVVERHGYIYFFNGPVALFPLPFFWGEQPDKFVAGKVFSYVADCEWYLNASHAFDMQHFASVHDRELTATPVVDCPAPFARRNSYSAKVIGQHLLDKLLYRFAGKTVNITISICGGTFVLVTADFGGAVSRFIISAQPLENGQTLCEGVCFAAPSGVPFYDRLALAVRRIFTHGYLAAETREIRGTEYRPDHLGPDDREMIEYYKWLAALPQDLEATFATPPDGNNNEKPVDRTVYPLHFHAGAVANGAA